MKRSLIDAFINTLAVILIVLALNQSLKIFLAGHWLSASGSMAFYLLLLILFLLRKPSKEAITQPGHFLVALGGTFLTLAIQFNPDPNPTLVGISLPFELTGAVFSVMALASLGRGFGVVAANREIKTHGMYRFIRHPLYMGEALWFFSLILQNLSPFNAVLFLTQIGCQILRMRDEESLLRKDPAYATYLEQVRYRMIPGLF